jgi:hypothetical protein
MNLYHFGGDLNYKNYTLIRVGRVSGHTEDLSHFNYIHFAQNNCPHLHFIPNQDSAGDLQGDR